MSVFNGSGRYFVILAGVLVSMAVGAVAYAGLINGTDAGEAITGTSTADEIHALGGDDTVNAGAGNDIVYGDAGEDVLNGGAGSDVIVGFDLSGYTDVDTVNCGNGIDYVVAEYDPSTRQISEAVNPQNCELIVINPNPNSPGSP